MKTEISSENKAKFFGLYIEQDVLHGQWGVNGNLIDLIGTKETYGKYWIELAHIYSITEEHVIEAAKIMKCEHHLDQKNIQEGIYEIKVAIKYDSLTWLCVEYLRSKGYALPWMGLTVEEMVEAGWIKLKS